LIAGFLFRRHGRKKERTSSIQSFLFKGRIEMSQSFFSNLNVGGSIPVSLGGTGIQTKYFPLPSGVVPPSISATSGLNGIIVPHGNNVNNGQILRVRTAGDFAIGNDAPTASPAVTLALYPVTFVGLIPIIGSTAVVSQVVAGASVKIPGGQPWVLSADLMCTSLSGLVSLVSGYINMDGTAGTVTPGLVSGLSGIDMSSPLPFGLVVGFTFSVSDPFAIANMYQFGISC
jgi:hypothetical protein